MTIFGGVKEGGEKKRSCPIDSASWRNLFMGLFFLEEEGRWRRRRRRGGICGLFLIWQVQKIRSHDDTVLPIFLGSHLVGFEVLDLFHVDRSPNLCK